MRLNWTATLLPLFLTMTVPLVAKASLGPFEHGSGIKSMGAGGLSYVGVGETTALSANPALVSSLGARYDAGLDVMMIRPRASIVGNQLAADDDYRSNGRNFYFIPQAGFSKPINERWSWGVTALMAGLGPDYKSSPYARFGGADRTSLMLGSASLATALAWKPVEGHSFGAGLVVGYETLKVTGVGFLASNDPQRRVSTEPDQVSDQGKAHGYSVGFTLGWTGQLTPQLAAGIGYRSKAWTQNLDEYRGLLPDGGSLELPTVHGVGLAWTPLAAWTFGLEWQRFAYGGEKAFGNRFAQLANGQLLGSPDGPGFGLRDQQVYKFGVRWKARPDLELRAGYVRANQNVRPSDTLFVILAPVTLTTHYTTGLTYVRGGWEFTSALAYCPRQTVYGQGSIPPAFGGGEANVSNQFSSFGFSLGRRF